jgi:hypothetical protein
MLCAMGAAVDERRIELIVRRVDDSLHGCASDDTGHVHEFTGWLGLLGALEALLADPASTTEDS